MNVGRRKGEEGRLEAQPSIKGGGVLYPTIAMTTMKKLRRRRMVYDDVPPPLVSNFSALLGGDLVT